MRLRTDASPGPLRTSLPTRRDTRFRLSIRGRLRSVSLVILTHALRVPVRTAIRGQPAGSRCCGPRSKSVTIQGGSPSAYIGQPGLRRWVVRMGSAVKNVLSPMATPVHAAPLHRGMRTDDQHTPPTRYVGEPTRVQPVPEMFWRDLYRAAWCRRSGWHGRLGTAPRAAGESGRRWGSDRHRRPAPLRHDEPFKAEVGSSG